MGSVRERGYEQFGSPVFKVSNLRWIRNARLNGLPDGNNTTMITIGLILMLCGFLLVIPVLWTVGVILLVVGLVLMLLGRSGRRVGSRAHYW